MVNVQRIMLFFLLIRVLPIACMLRVENGIRRKEPDILESEVKWALESITRNKDSGGDGIPVELFQILKDDAVKVLHSICQQIWKTQQWPQDFHCNSKERQCQRMFKLPYNCTHFTC